MENTHILLAEDDPNLGQLLKESLEMNDYLVTLCRNGQDAWKAYLKDDSFDMCVFDVMMPLKDGFTLAKDIRKQDDQIPIVFLTAKSQKKDTIEGLKVGADDYLAKPFSMEELLLRIEAILRRATGPPEKKVAELSGDVQLGKYTFLPDRRLLVHDEEERKLTHKEAELLKILIMHKNEILERQVALQAVWNDDSYFNGRSMDVYMAKIRKYLAEDANLEIQNVHGIGFKLIEYK